MTSPLPETILQFGTGRFLRAFADFFIHHANETGQNVGRVVAVQSTDSQRADLLNAHPEGYHLAVRGVEKGKTIDRVDAVRSISRSLSAASQWDAVLKVARSPELKAILSNTTETGFVLDPADKQTDAPPHSFPAKLTQVLLARFEAGRPGISVLPCELIEKNGPKLRDLVLGVARGWGLSGEFCRWVTEQCSWPSSLVDRMVVGPTPDLPLYEKDPLLLMTEPYALWGIERPSADWQPPCTHPSIEVVDDLAPYYLRKVRILNGVHTALVAKWMPQGFETVQQALKDERVMDWVLGLVYEEIVPAIAYRVPDVARFARETLERMGNPFMVHKLSDIRFNHEEKLKIRLRTTFDEYQKLFGKTPVKLAEILGM